MIRLLVSLLLFVGTACKRDKMVQNGDSELDPLETVAVTAPKPVNNIDQRVNLQKLIDEASRTRQTLTLAAGKYTVSDFLVLPSNITIEGVGDNSEIILTGGSKANRRVFTVNKNTSNVKLKNLKINANQSANSGSQLVALFVAEKVSNLHLENVTIEGGRDQGAMQVKGLNSAPVNGLTITRCAFTAAGRTSLELRGTSNVTVENSTFGAWGSQNPNSPAIQLQSEENKNVKIVNNVFNNKFGKQFAIECAAAYVSDALISGNKLNDSPNLGGNGISGYYRRTQITNNTLTGGNGNQRSGLEIFGNNNTITNNVVPYGSLVLSGGLKEEGYAVLVKDNIIKTKGTNVAGVSIGHGCCVLRDIKIINNTVDTRAASGNSSGIVVGTYGVPQVVKNITIENNTISSSSNCIRLQALAGSTDIFLNNNICKVGQNWLAVITNTFKNVVASGNRIEISNKKILYAVAGTPAVVVK